ncbi:MAG TPA: hypothetical protein DEO85_09785 [Maritimibacter sp.]|nr:hypothetical protein [Maritimibacter sp.]
MGRLDDIRKDSTWGQILEGQPQHLLIGALLVVGAASLLIGDAHPPRTLGLTAVGWAMVSIWLAILHQVLVAIVFRLQLHKALLSRIFGAHDMTVWTAIFVPLLVARPLTILMTAITDTAPLPEPRWAQVLIGVLLLAPAIWGMHSTLKHFTLRRAVGGDHFREDIRALPRVTGGLFNYTDNGMYGVVFFGLWGIALVFGSWNALIVALFQHAYIWVHMYCTEAPDMRRLYG